MTKDLQEKCEYHRTLLEYFCLHFFIDPIFILQNIVSVLDAFQEITRYVFKKNFMLMTMQKDSDRQLQARQNAGRIDMVILLSIRMLC